MSESSAYNLLEPILASAARHPERRALATLNESVTYGQLRDLIQNCALHMRQHGIDRGGRVALWGEHPLIMTTLAFACAMVGCSWVRASPFALGHAPLRLTHCLHIGPPPGGGRVKMVSVGPEWTRPPRGPSAAQSPAFTFHRSPREIWMVSHSSGTTGTPKYMALEAGSVWRRGMDHLLAFTREDPVFVSLFPMLSTLNLVPAMQVLATGGTFAFADLADLFGGLHVDGVLGSPNHYLDFMNETPPGDARIPGCIVTGAMIGPEFVRRLAMYVDSITYLYGSTEAGTICTAKIEPGADDSAGFGVGRARPGAEVEILSDTGAQMPPGQEGRVRVRTQALTSGYLGDPMATAEFFQDGWFHPGDAGYLTEAGELHITGRLSDLVNIGGVKRNPAMIDEAVRACPGVADGACFAERSADGIDRISAAIRLNGPLDLAALKPALREAVARRTGHDTVPRKVYLVTDIPRNASGKTQRHLLPQAVREATVIEMDDEG